MNLALHVQSGVRSRPRHALRCVLALMTLLGAPLAAMSQTSLVRHTTSGAVEGIRDLSGTVAWLGIPYAAPPVGALRWKAPVPHVAWRGVRRAQRFGHACTQMGSLQGPGLREEEFDASVADAFGVPVGNEDCLTLNVWRPNDAATKLPVIVFVHGGANVAGYSADPLYHGAALTQRLGAMVVTINYRLGVFGWFAHPALERGADSGDASGNFGLLDMVRALEFVRDNAAAFGGDARNVTLIGQSAGGVNTLALMTSSLGEQLFHRAVVLSGALVAVPRAASHAYTAKVVAELLVADGVAPDAAAAAKLAESKGEDWVRSYLYGKPASALAATAAKVQGGGLPTADGVVLPLDLAAAMRTGTRMTIPILMGMTRDEGRFFVQGVYRMSDAERFRAMLAPNANSNPTVTLADMLKPEYASPEKFAAAAEATGSVVRHLLEGTREIVSGRGPTYSMEFAWARQDEPWRTLIGAEHGMELPFLFRTFGPSLYSVSFNERNAEGREQLSQALAAALHAFVRIGAPSVSSMGATWKPWSLGSKSTVVFDATDDALRLRVDPR